ncbi:MAG: SpoIID/LytB domain-containing protein [Actinomycetota bacterium]|nr:SpoIID/LytB domain-containing protein [Actinomycetota bacterium]
MRRFAGAVALSLVASVAVIGPAYAGRTVTITGGGWGHGIGMSQYGAYGRALNGKSATQILTHYYTGVSIDKKSMPSIRIGLVQSASSITSTTSEFTTGGGKATFKVAGARGVVASGGSGTSWKVDASPAGGVHLFKNGKSISVDGNPVLGDDQHPLVMTFERFGTLVHVASKSSYAYGTLRFESYATSSCSSGHCLRLVLQASMQHYLYGLGEVPASWPHAALQAQAIAGRTYAFQKIANVGQHRYPCDCAVYDSTMDQSYIGDAKRTGSGQYWDDWKGAVDATDGQVIQYNGQPIDALYSSSSGGFTENNENVWGGSPIPYLRGVSDGPDAVSANPNHSWTVTMSWDTFQSKLNAYYGVGDLKDFATEKPYGVSGRVTVPGSDRSRGGALITGTSKTVHVSGWSVRAALGLKDTLFRVDLGYDTGQQFVQHYRSLDGAPGRPESSVYAVPRGWKKSRGVAQDFSNGRMTWNRALHRALWLHGPVLTYYDTVGRESSRLGMPTSDLWGKGRYRGASFVNGAVYWSHASKAHSVSGDFLVAYRHSGGPTGALGLPVARQSSAGGLAHGKQRFEQGTIYMNPAVDHAFALWGHVDAAYRKLRKARSKCGLPTSQTQNSRAALSATFQHGTITWTQATGIKVACAAS